MTRGGEPRLARETSLSHATSDVTLISNTFPPSLIVIVIRMDVLMPWV